VPEIARFAGSDSDAGDGQDLETFGLDRDRIGSRENIRYAEKTRAVGCCGIDTGSTLVGQTDHGGRDYTTGRVNNRTQDRTGDRLAE
jgi:hypothetical protein